MAMKLKEVVEGDFRIGETESEAQRWLLKIKPLANRTPEGEKVKFEDIEKLIIKLSAKNKVVMQFISLTLIDGEVPWYSVSLKDGKTYERVKTVYGLTIYELYAKVALFMFASLREGS
jgi:hypothetical protein